MRIAKFYKKNMGLVFSGSPLIQEDEVTFLRKFFFSRETPTHLYTATYRHYYLSVEGGSFLPRPHRLLIVVSV
jgi:hypothetical protein